MKQIPFFFFLFTYLLCSCTTVYLTSSNKTPLYRFAVVQLWTCTMTRSLFDFIQDCSHPLSTQNNNSGRTWPEGQSLRSLQVYCSWCFFLSFFFSAHLACWQVSSVHPSIRPNALRGWSLRTSQCPSLRRLSSSDAGWLCSSSAWGDTRWERHLGSWVLTLVFHNEV